MIRDFVYLKASSIKETLDLLETHKDDCKIICGGQSLLILMRQGLVAPENLIDIKSVKELSYIKYSSKAGLRIGATTTHRDIEKSSVIKKHYPVLVDMEESLASIQTRNWGTIGGNLAHADPAGDPGPLLMALDARVSMANKKRIRTLPLEEFFIDFFETALEESELLLEIQVPPVPPMTATAYEKFNIIKNDQPIVSVAASLTLDEDGLRCKDARLVLGGAAPVPLRAKEAERMLKGKKMNEALLEQAGNKASKEAEPVADIHASEEYRRYLIKALTKKMVKKVWADAQTLTS